MRHLLVPAALAGFGALLAQDTAPRQITPLPIPLSVSLMTISGVRELRDGKLLVSDPKSSIVCVVDPVTQSMTRIGSAGGDELQYAQPGGFYPGHGDTTLLLDRGLAKALVIGPNGSIIGMKSIKRNGIRSTSDDDVDHQHIDARGLTYFTMLDPISSKHGQGMVDSSVLVRFDHARQHYDTVTFLRVRESRLVQATENTQLTQAVIGSPADAWGVASDGRVAVIRAVPYHVEWIGTDGRIVRGPTYTTPAVGFTQAERDSIVARSSSGGGVSATGIGQPSTSSSKSPQYFSDAKAPFAGETSALVSPQSQVWVARSAPFRTPNTIYDVFNARGERVDRVSLAGNVRVVGFGNSAVYAVTRDASGRPSLAKYKL